jgi:hypothetical protein
MRSLVDSRSAVGLNMVPARGIWLQILSPGQRAANSAGAFVARGDVHERLSAAIGDRTEGHSVSL